MKDIEILTKVIEKNMILYDENIFPYYKTLPKNTEKGKIKDFLELIPNTKGNKKTLR